ncbi:ABC transporter permease subunit [Cryptosporangium phraense]|uniref:ABC transporter permease subunit n=1 Tax=Cryptosporangium phraense TaxID=2593070 RepID=A0A545AYI5_9ACTN|nr:ABC transporter permease subunit [Cryptosporangium phraense]TQS46383.1 ABC transporter permease subunit [Cryptosporangium phraense]
MIRAELTKLFSLRSTAILLGLSVLAAAGLSALLGSAMRDVPDERFDPLFASFYGMTVAQLALVVFAVQAIGSEYRSGTIRWSLLAVPRRGSFYAAKAVATFALLAATALVMVPATFVPAQIALAGRGIGPADADAPEALAGAWIYLVLLGLFAFGVATALRNPVVSLGILLPLLLLGSQGLGNVPGINVVTQYLPDQLGWVILHLAGPQDDPRWARSYGPWTGLGLLAVWTLAALAAGYVVLRRRDA